MIIQDTWLLLKEKKSSIIDQLRIEDLRIGQFLCAVKLSDSSWGISSTIEDTRIQCDKKHRDYGDFTPLRIKDKYVRELFETSKNSAIITMLRMACLNALSSAELSNDKYKIRKNTDPFDLLDIDKGSRVVIVGAFHSYIDKCIDFGCSFGVLELDQEALSPQHRHLYIPAENYNDVIPEADFLIITGLTLVNDTLERLLEAVTSNTKVIVTGPSSSIIPVPA